MKTLHPLGILPLLLLPFVAMPAPSWAVKTTAIAATKQATQTATLRTLTQNEETLYLNPEAVYELSLRLDQTATLNGVTLPAGTVIQGQLEPVDGGLRYVAAYVETGSGLRRNLSATSEVLTDVKDPRETSAGSIAGDAAIGAAGAAILGGILGDVDTVEVLGGAAAGVIVGNVTAQRVVVIEPEQPLQLQVR